MQRSSRSSSRPRRMRAQQDSCGRPLTPLFDVPMSGCLGLLAGSP
jgi:hypothetical protein